MRTPLVLLLLLVATPAPRLVLAHDFWIQADPYRLREPGAVQLSLIVGEGLRGETLPYIPDWFEDFSVLDAGGRRPVESIIGDDPAANLAVASGTTVVAYQSKRNFVELSAAKFATYLLEEGLESVHRMRRQLGRGDQPATEYFIRCAKALLHAGPPDDSRVFAKTVGYTLELVPLHDPAKLSKGDTFATQLLYRSEPLAGSRIRAIPAAKPEDYIDRQADADGRASFTLHHKGQWLIKSVHMIPLGDQEQAEWESYWASLTFDLE